MRLRFVRRMNGYGHHPSFERPNGDDRLWRYVDFAKFVDMLDRGALYFARADKMIDPWEGALSASMEDAYEETFRRELEELVANPPPELRDAPRLHDPGAHNWTISELRADYRRHWLKFRSRMFLSCWYRSEYESAAMWDLYAGSNPGGVAIQSTFDRLERALPAQYPYMIYAGKVRYIDYHRALIPLGNNFDRFLHKRRSFEHEREVRAIFDTHRDDTLEPGFNVPIDLEALVERVHVAPLSPPWFAELVQKTIARYGLATPVRHSDLFSGPVE